MPKIKVNDINIYYEIHGEGHPIVMIGGLASNVYKWEPEFIKKISEHYKTIIFSNRGAGRSDKPKIDYTIKMFADDTAVLMDTLGLKRAYVLGHSMGGMIAQELVLNYPEKVNKLILCSTNCGGSKNVHASKEIVNILKEKPIGLTNEEIIRKSNTLIYSDDFMRKNPEFIENYVRRTLISPIPRFSFIQQFFASAKHNTGKRLKNINVQTLVLHGTKDVLIPYQNGEIIAKLIPNSRFVLLENIAHMIFAEDTINTSKLIVEFLNNEEN